MWMWGGKKREMKEREGREGGRELGRRMAMKFKWNEDEMKVKWKLQIFLIFEVLRSFVNIVRNEKFSLSFAGGSA